MFALFSGIGTPLVSNETAGRLMGAGTLSTFLSSESAPEFSEIILPEKPLLSTLAQLTLLDERFSFGTAAFFADAGSTFWSLMAVHLTPYVLRDGQSRSLVVAVLIPVFQQGRLVSNGEIQGLSATGLVSVWFSRAFDGLVIKY